MASRISPWEGANVHDGIPRFVMVLVLKACRLEKDCPQHRCDSALNLWATSMLHRTHYVAYRVERIIPTRPARRKSRALQTDIR